MVNEPHRTYIQIPSLHAFDYNTDLDLSHVRKSNSLATHASLNPLRSFRLPILPGGCWPPLIFRHDAVSSLNLFMLHGAPTIHAVPTSDVRRLSGWNNRGRVR